VHTILRCTSHEKELMIPFEMFWNPYVMVVGIHPK
jgi:hypothetical protein